MVIWKSRTHLPRVKELWIFSSASADSQCCCQYALDNFLTLPQADHFQLIMYKTLCGTSEFWFGDWAADDTCGIFQVEELP